jgi:hypothetical protein
VTKTRGHSGERFDRFGPAPHACCLPWIIIGWLLCISLDAHAGPLVTTESPIGFFTNVATRLLQSQLGMSLNHIQLYPTNQYTPSVHRLLQVTANVYDSLTNRPTTGYPYLPSVFRPVFARSSPRLGLQIYICGFEEVTNTSVLSERMVDLNDPNALAQLKPYDMIWGIPLVIGAKKGFPNFNEFVRQTSVQISRKLEFRRAVGDNNGPIIQTNQMYVLSISNAFGIGAWNSYSASYPRALSISVIAMNMNAYLTDAQRGQSWFYYMNFSANQNVAANTWAGFIDANHAAVSFQYPLWTNFLTLTNSQYLQNPNPPQLVPVIGQGLTFERPSGLRTPDWWLTFTNRLQFAIVDAGAGRIVDYVNLDGGGTPMHISALMGGAGCSSSPYSPSTIPSDAWCTNSGFGVVPYGVLNQIFTSLGAQPNFWSSVPANWAPCDFFRAQFYLSPIRPMSPPMTYYTTNTFYAPYVATWATNFYTVWQANDPLVHYMPSDLVGLPSRSSPLVTGVINASYQPWGGNPLYSSSSTTRFNLALKDPVITADSPFGSSDDWDFPTNSLPGLTWLGRVHRGTPWQTLYLKAAGIDLPTWRTWTGNSQLVTNTGQFSTNLVLPGSAVYYPFTTSPTVTFSNGVVAYDAFFTQPTSDWRVASLLVSLLSTNDPRNLASVNQPSAPAWCGLLDGMTVLTNTDIGQFASVIMSSGSPQAVTIATALVAARSSQPGQLFHDIGDILATPELSTASPWLNLSGDPQLGWVITDEAYEAIPSQLLPLLRPDSIGSVSQVAGTLQVQFSGIDGYAYVVQTSSNLSQWTALTTNYPANGSFNFVDTPPPGSPRRFYRSVLWP